MILFSEAALDDLEKIFEFNADHDPAIALDHIDKIQSAVTLIELHPEIGRRVMSRCTSIRLWQTGFAFSPCAISAKRDIRTVKAL